MEEGPQGSHEQEKDSDGVWDAPRLPESTAEPASMAGVLVQQVRADYETDEVGDLASSEVDDRLWGGDDKQDEGNGQLQVLYRSTIFVSILKEGRSSSWI